jgi:hypothetical protein
VSLPEEENLRRGASTKKNAIDLTRLKKINQTPVICAIHDTNEVCDSELGGNPGVLETMID